MIFASSEKRRANTRARTLECCATGASSTLSVDCFGTPESGLKDDGCIRSFPLCEEQTPITNYLRA